MPVDLKDAHTASLIERATLVAAVLSGYGARHEIGSLSAGVDTARGIVVIELIDAQSRALIRVRIDGDGNMHCQEYAGPHADAISALLQGALVEAGGRVVRNAAVN